MSSPSNQLPQKESDRALEAKHRFAAMPAEQRSLSRLAAEMYGEQLARANAAQAEGLRRPKVQHPKVIERRLKEWSRAFDWQEFIEQQERERYAAQQAAIREQAEAQDREMNAIQGDITRGLFIRSMTRINQLLEDDEADRQRFLSDLEAFYSMPEIERMEAKPPKRPGAAFGPFALVQLGRLTLEGERIARGAMLEALQRLSQRGEAEMLPEVFEVETTPAPPPEPVDPYEDDIAGAAAEALEVYAEIAPGALGDDDDVAANPGRTAPAVPAPPMPASPGAAYAGFGLPLPRGAGSNDEVDEYGWLDEQ